MEKEAKTHKVYSIDGLNVECRKGKGAKDKVEIVIPDGMPYAAVRKALERAILRVR